MSAFSFLLTGVLLRWMIAVPSLTKGVAQGAGLATRNHSSSTVNVPSELLLQLVDVSRSVQKLLPSSDLKGIAPDGEDQGGYDSLLSLALRHHALLQQRNEDLLTQHARCTAQVEALREDKQELRQQIQEYKLQIRQLIKGEDKHATSIDHIDPSVLDVKTTPAVGFDVDETCSCGENGTLGHRDENGCICGAPTTTTTEEQPSTTETPILGEGVRVKDCAGHQYEGATQSGIYEIYPSECYGVRVWCDLETDGGGWTVFLNRQEQPKQENFTRTWEEYRDGFGDVSSEYWLGNEILHQLTAKDEHVLRVDAEDFNQSRRWGVWERFRVEDEEHNYKLLSVMYSSNSTLGDGLLWHSGMQFSTIDRDNDKHKGSCSDEYKGGWWYNVCHNANPTGILVNSDDFDSVGWVYWSPRQYKWASLRFLQMKLRPKAFGTPDPTSPPRDCASA